MAYWFCSGRDGFLKELIITREIETDGTSRLDINHPTNYDFKAYD